MLICPLSQNLYVNFLALKAIKAEPKEHFSDYHYTNNKVPPPPSTKRSAFYKLRSLSIIFKLRKLPRAQLKSMCATLGIKYRDLMYDMPIQWNSTDKMLTIGLYMEKAIKAVLTT
jgi:hypothetical protein